MNKNGKKRPFMTVGIITLVTILTATLFLAYRIYQNTVRETKTVQGLRQVQMVQNAAIRIEFYLQHLTKDMHMLGTLPCLQTFDEDAIAVNVKHFFVSSNPLAVKSIFVVNKKDELIYSTSDGLPDWLNPQLEKGLDAFAAYNQTDSVWVSQVTKHAMSNGNDGLFFIVLVPVLRTNSSQNRLYAGSQFMGVLGFLVDFNAVMHRFVKPIKFGKTGFAWVMDQDGRLLFHPHHPEMVLRSIFATKTECTQCHTSFEKQIIFLNSHADYQELQVGNERPKLMAKASMNAFNVRWDIAASIDRAEVVSVIQYNYRLFLWLVGLSLLTILSAGVLLLHLNIKRFQAEEYSRHCEEKNQLQEQINHAAKLASIGELVDSVAHEINTPTGIISAQIDAMQLQTEENADQEVCRIIREQTRRIAKYTKSLLRHSRGMTFQPRPTNIIDVIEECLMLLGHRFRAKQIIIEKAWPAGLPEIFLDRDQILQVFINLLNNALDVLPQNGKIKLELKTTKRMAKLKGIEIRLSDNGPGIPPEDMDNIFKPFFSTKPPEEGTGLGLGISQAIIQRHQGTMQVQSAPGRGTTFNIFLPNNQNDLEMRNG